MSLNWYRFPLSSEHNQAIFNSDFTRYRIPIDAGWSNWSVASKVVYTRHIPTSFPITRLSALLYALRLPLK